MPNADLDPIDVTVGARIRERRRALRLSQAQLGEALGVRGQMIGKYEAGESGASAGALVVIAARLETSVAWLVDEIEPPLVAVGRSDLHSDGAAELLAAYATIEDVDLRKALCVLGSVLTRERLANDDRD